MGLQDVGYDGVMRSARALLQVAAPFNDKLRRGLSGRALALEQMQRWSTQQRDREAPLLWLHAPSVGEALMAQAIVSALRGRRPGLQIAFTHFSPSAERMRERVGADLATYLPWDTTTEMQAALATLQPAAVVFVRSEIWPTLGRLARLHSVPVALVNAVLPAASSRLRPWARIALRSAYQRLDAVGAVDAAAADRFQMLCVPRERTWVSGDARFDQVWQRVRSLDRASALLQRVADPAVTTVVAGSTWPADEERVLPAFRQMRQARLMVAPHEPTATRLKGLETNLQRTGLRHARLSQIEQPSIGLPEVVVVDRIGVLADLYAVADIAYVGGAFHRAGVHSVVEPAALGVPVLFGAQHGNAVEAQELIDAGGGLSVSSGHALAHALVQFAADVEARRQMGRNARAYVLHKLGGAERNAALIEGLLERRSPPAD
jgi:3-deoxy-D-manno-octulosonic-acid transferase